FMSPEQCAGAQLDGRSDIFSLGSSLYYLLTATPPFGRGEPAAVLHRLLTRQAPQPVHLVSPAVPRAVSDLVARCMELDPLHRLQAADEPHGAIRQLLAQHARQPAPAPTPVPKAADTSLWSAELNRSLAPLELVPLDLSDTRPPTRRAGWVTLA